jgi:hypothetical protein
MRQGRGGWQAQAAGAPLTLLQTTLVAPAALLAVRSFGLRRVCLYMCVSRPLPPLCLQTAVRLVLAGELGRHAVTEGKKAVARYTGLQ